MTILFKNVMVKELPEGEKVTSTGLFLGNAKTDYRKPTMSEIVGVGSEVDSNIQVGKYAMYMPGVGDAIECDGYKLRVLDESCIFLVADKDETIEA